ncbi:hypothetical protein QYF36_027000 [Acer negundo]|nr:hypothetical protein QYF36_027000 [Acer negundo]
MWKLKIGEDGAWLSSVNDHIGRQHWEFDPHAGTPQELALVETLRSHFNHNRFQLKQSSDLLMRMQVSAILIFIVNMFNCNLKCLFSQHREWPT